jgi:hypothetical protein
VHAELIRQATDGEVVYNYDTSMTVLSLLEPSPPATAGGIADDAVSPTRTGGCAARSRISGIASADQRLRGS